MQATLRDLRYGARTLRKTPGLAIVAVLALTLGIALTTMMFSIVYGALMKGLPFPEGERILALTRVNRATGDTDDALSVHEYYDVAAQQRSFEALAAYSSGTVNVSDGERAERYDGSFVSGNLFRVLQVQPLLGRTFRDGEERADGERVTVIGYRMWQDRFAGDRGVIGRTLRANGNVYTIVGVMPEGMLFPFRQQIWIPQIADPLKEKRNEGTWVDVIGRLKPGVSLDQANADLAAIYKRFETDHKETNENISGQIVPFVEASLGKEPKQLLFTMLGAVFLVLLIACTNVANLLLGRAAFRVKEVGIRTALGASRWDVVRQFLLEAFVLAAVATLLGTVLAQAGITAFNRAIVDSEPPYWIDIALHPPVLLFSAALALFATLAAGTIPALQSSRGDMHDVLKDETRGSSGLRIGRVSRALVVAEIALSCALLVAAGLMVKSIANLRTIDYGFRTDGIFTARLGFPVAYTDTLAQIRFFEQLEQRLAELPGAHSAALASGLPGTGQGKGIVGVEGKTYATDRDYPKAANLVVTPGFFAAFDIPARQGRLLQPTDRREAGFVAVANERFARENFGSADAAIGRRVRFGNAKSERPWMTIVGVVPDLHSGDNEDPRPPTVYIPLAQQHRNFVSVIVRGRGGDPMALTQPVREAVGSLNADIPIYWVYSMREALARPTWFYRVFGTLFMIFGGVALFLATIGLYAVMAFAVGRRTREFGIRMALGAQARDVVRLIMRQGAWQLAIGMVAGLAAAAGVAQLMTIVLFEVKPRDPVIFVGVAVVLAAAGMLACLLPAVRATRVAPVSALRTD